MCGNRGTSVAVGRSVGTVCRGGRSWVEYPRAPVFTDSAASLRWQREFPDRLREYYEACKKYGPSWSCGGDKGGDSTQAGSGCVDTQQGESSVGFDDGVAASVVDSGDAASFDDIGGSKCAEPCGLEAVDEVVEALVVGVGTGVPEKESKYDRNRRWAAEKKKRKLRKQSGLSGGFVPEWRVKAPVAKIGQVVAGCVAAEDVDGELKDSVKRKWKAKNELEIAKAQRELEVLKGNSVEDEVRSRQVGTRAAIERSMVSIERTHAQLRKADCVIRSDDDVVSGTVETLVSGVSSGTISPNSSVSEAEVRKLQKDFADGQAENERLRSALSRVGLDLAMVDAMDKKEWTVDHTGHVSEEVEDVFDRLYPRGTAYPDDPHMCDDGKLRRTIIGF